jgi:Yip1 domain
VTAPAPLEVPDPQAPPPRGGWLLLADIIVAPSRAFRTIAATSEWLPAFGIVAALGLGGVALIAPALRHLVMVESRLNPGGPVASPAELLATANAFVASQALFQTLGVLLMWIWTAVILAAVSGSGPRRFRTYFALAANAAIPSALGFLLFSLVVRLHDPASFSSLSQLNLALPDSLAVFEPHGTDRAIAFLSFFDVFQAWSLLLVAYGLRAIGNVRLVPALVTSFAIGLAFALLQIATGL